GTFLAQMGLPDMRFPIQYVLTYPEKLPNPWPKMRFSELKSLTFHAPDFEKFPLLQLAFDSGKQGGSTPLVMNAANEVAVRLFLDKKIKFLDIANLVRHTVEKLGQEVCITFEDILALDHRVKEEVGCRFA
ncbi:MAG: 1-deoxy-D-xylulose-5-phosphate reductoisomerase, partial [Candidatus Margulisbacteria bacterium]|nr:1-deoxy-D-xylulose-5-phosphate reductoisomerase [Candidatus Margulisiibacteriota bacterium]